MNGVPFFIFFSADDLRDGLDIPRLAQLRQARAFRDWAEETLRIIEVRSQDTAPV
jgi:hypothetical protein